MSRRTFMPALVGLAVFLTAGLAMAQDGGGGGGGGGGGRRGGFGGDPAQFRQRMLENIKERLAAKDDEWAVLQPKLEKVLEAQRDARAGGGGFGGGRRGGGGGGGGGGFGGGAADTAVGRAMADLRTTIENESASAEEISAKLAALREARTKANETLASAQKELKEVLTQRQEAVLVTMNMLE